MNQVFKPMSQLWKQLLTGVALCLIAAAPALSQTKSIVVAGRVMEDTGEPAVQATVQLLHLPDSVQAAGVASNNQGYFTLPKAKEGRYVLKVSYIGFKNKFVPLRLTAERPNRNVGILTLESDAVMLKEAVVTAEAPQVQIVEDTVAFNSSAFRTPQGAMLEELVKKLPGAEVDDDGNVKINGKEVKKLMVNGKEFFGGDVKTGLKNLPVDMVDKLKTYDKKSDLARITGIDDGEEETVLDLTVKKGMNQGVFGNIDLSLGTKNRYMEKAMVNYFSDHSQVSLIAGANNVNDQGFSGGGGGPRWRRNNGLTDTKELGLNFATESSKVEMGGSVRYNYRGNKAVSTGYAENFLPAGSNPSSSFSNSNSRSVTSNSTINADFRLEWKPDSMTNIIFRPNFSWGDNDGSSLSESATFNSDPFLVIDNPNDYLDLDKLAKADILDDDPLKAIRVNTSNSSSVSESNSLSASASLQLNRKFGTKGRNITLRLNGGYSDNDSEQYSMVDTRYFQSTNNDNSIRRFITTPTSNWNYSARLTYSEPIAKATFLQFSYNFQYKYSESDKSTYDLTGTSWNLGDLLPSGYESMKDWEQSKYAEYKYFNHEAMVGLRFIRKIWQLNVGATMQPQHTILSYRKGDFMTDTTRNVTNFAPNVDLRIRFSKVSQLRLNYRGRSSQPSMENLLPITDNSNPLNIRMGNPGLKPSFSHNVMLFYNTYNAEKQRGIFTHGRVQVTQNSISNMRTYDSTTGGWTTKPENINGNWNAFGMFGINTALKNKKFTIGTFSRINYTNNVGYVTTSGQKDSQKNTTTDLTLEERLNGTFRNDWLEFGVSGSINYSIEKDKLTPTNNQEPYNYSYGANTTITMPWNMSLATNIANQSRRGYSDSSMNRDELIWNAQLSQTFLKGAATLSFEMYDILKQQSNITRSLTANGRSVYQYNGINSYCMFHFIYRLNIFGSKSAREKAKNMQQGFGPFGGGPGGHGRPMGPPPGGRRPF